MKTEEVPVADLLEMSAKYNPRKIDESDMESLRHSIREWGFVEPVVVNKTSGMVVGGHQRIEAAKLEGIETVPVFYVELDEASERSLNLALNRISGEWDDAKLLGVLSALSEEYVALAGFSEGEVETLYSRMAYAGEGTSDGTHIALTPEETGWAESSIRSVILPYDVETHGKVLEMMEKARREMKVDNNSDLILGLLSGA